MESGTGSELELQATSCLCPCFLTKTLGTRKAKEIWDWIDHRLDLWERRIHADLVGDALAEESASDGCITRRNEEEEDCLVCSFHITFLLVKLWQAVHQATGREGGKVSSPGGCLQEDRVTSCRCPL